MTDEMLNIVWDLMNDNQRTTWHYIMDIHDPETYWYSLGL